MGKKVIKYGNSSVLATAVLLRIVRDNLSQLEEMNWDSENLTWDENLLASDDTYRNLTELSNKLLRTIGKGINYREALDGYMDSLRVSIYDHSGGGLPGGEDKDNFVFPKGMYDCYELTNDWLKWYGDTKESKEA
tara:strand:- start:581 stop:985 length:405 start_codon:yes stop_codon:yes gene_type:complete